MRILIVTVPLPTTANPNTMAPLTRQVESLRRLGYDMDVLEIKGIPKLKYCQSLSELYARSKHADLIHAHYGYCGWLARCQFSKPVVVSFMGSDLLGDPDARGRVRPLSKFVAQIDRYFARTVASVIVKSAEMAEAVKPVRAHIVPNGVDMDAFRPMEVQQARAMLGWPENKRYILFSGNPKNPRKCFPLAQAAVSRASALMNEPLHLVPLRGVAPEKVPLYMNSCEAMLMTSFIEGSPNVVKEAMACNLPVVSVPVGDVSMLLDGVPGYEICPRNAKLLAESLSKILLNGHRVEGRAALKSKRLDLESSAMQLVKIYTDVLANWRN